MDNLNNLYNFKNTVRHFLNIDNIIMPSDIDKYDSNNLSWTESIKFKIKKDDNHYRILKIPNILNFICTIKHFEKYPNFYSVNSMDDKKE